MSGTLPLRSLELIVFIIDTYILPLDAVELHKIFTDKELAYIAYLVRKYTKKSYLKHICFLFIGQSMECYILL